MNDVIKKDPTIRQLFKRVIKDCLTGKNGSDYDPARVIGYGVVVMGSVVFIFLAIYDTFMNKKFDYNGYAAGISGIGLSLAAAAAGVWMKKDTENEHKTIENGNIVQ